jgi:hypothetical protein
MKTFAARFVAVLFGAVVLSVLPSSAFGAKNSFPCGKFFCNSYTQGCCAGVCYNYLTKQCVNGKVMSLPLKPRPTRLPRQAPVIKVAPTPKPTPTLGPNCNGTPYNPAVDICCGKFICNSLTQGCCNGICYNKLTRECVNNQIQTLPLTRPPRPTPKAKATRPPTATAAPQLPTRTPTATPIPVQECPSYNTMTQGCCGGTVIPYSTTRAGCCGMIYGLYRNSCSNGVIVPR